ncbi:MAG: hypothetical protein H8E44_19695 [Planctomycetes bacterium]|nr:hypothetical protein [Planctomycetota bacterium]
MSQVTLEERVARLEKLFDDWVHGQLDRREPGRDDWMKTVGMFAGDPVMKEIIEEGRRVREQDRQETQMDRP